MVNDEGLVDRADVEAGEKVRACRVTNSGQDAAANVIVTGLQRAFPGVRVETERTTLQPINVDVLGTVAAEAIAASAPSSAE